MKSDSDSIAEGALYTDFYQLTMAQVYYREDMHEIPARFEHFFRSYPDYGEHQAGYCVNAGLEWFLDWLEDLSFTEPEIRNLREHRNGEGERLFSEDFLTWLGEQQLDERLTIQAIPEGRVVHPNFPLTVVEGPLALAQLVETPLLNLINYQVLVATKASRIKQAGNENLLLEFGMRRAHDRGANAGARAALIGGADFSSNTGISYELGLPPKGTHAHSLIQAYLARGKSELDAFRAFARQYPDNCILLVDTVDTLKSGLPNAIEVFKELREAGHEPVGIRLDSGDLAHLAVRARKQLNEAGFEETTVVLSDQLDEQVLAQIGQQIEAEAPEYGLAPEAVLSRLAYGVGTRMITSAGDAALGGVYKLVGLKDDGEWEPVLKLSENPEKIPTPGQKQGWRLYDDRGRATADLLGLPTENIDTEEPVVLRHPSNSRIKRRVEPEELSDVEKLHETVLETGQRQYHAVLQDCRERRRRDLAKLDAGVKRIMYPHRYHVSLTPALRELRETELDALNNFKDP